MTTIITRAYKDLDTAKAVVAKLREEGFPARDVALFNKGDTDIAKKMAAAKVAEETIPAFARAAEGGKPVVVVRAEITPFGAARKAMDICDSFSPAKVGQVPVNQYRGGGAKRNAADYIMADHRRFLSSDMDPHRKKPHRFWSENFGWRLLSRRTPDPNSVISGGEHVSQRFFSYPLLSDKKPREGSVMPDAPFMSQKFWPAKLLSTR